MAEPLIDYPALLRRALLAAIRELLARVAEEGFPGEHHAYITFRTDHPDVVLPGQLRRQYPREMTLVLQHQFWELAVDETRFSVTLRFGGKPVRVSVPFEAIQSFADPAAEFGLRLEPESAAPAPSAGRTEAAHPSGAEVVEFDRFRPKRES